MYTSRPGALLLGASLAVVTACLLPSAALAHLGAEFSAGLGAGKGSVFAQGLVHPVTGFDHLLAMVAVGLWAAQCGGRMLWLAPLSFVLVMAGGAVLGALSLPLPLVESGILASVLILGLLLVFSARLPLVAASLLLGVCAFFHGHAHGTELPAQAALATYGAGFLLTTLCLHGLGLGFGLAARFWAMPLALRYAGGGMVAAGLVLMLG